MTDQRGLLSYDAPVVDQSRLRGRPGVERPKPAPSLIDQFSVAARGAAANDDPAADQARQQEAVDNALAPIVADLQRRGVAGDFTARRVRDGFALSYNQDAIWQGIARARQADPKAFEGVDADPAAFRQKATAAIRGRIADERDVQQRSSWAPWLAGQFVGGTSDPINQAGMLAGLGPARTIAQAALRDAVVNTQIEAVQAPVRAIAKAKQGQDTTVGEVAQDLALAAGTGAAFGGVVHGAGEYVAKPAIQAALRTEAGQAVARGATEAAAATTRFGGRVKGAAGQLADKIRATIGVERMTDAERAAVTTLDRIDEAAAISPFVPGAGSDGHLARIDRATTQLTAPADASRTPAAPAPVPRFDAQTYANRVAVAESGGKWQVQAPTSSAYGLYQITRGTWLRYADAARIRSVTDEATWNKRTNPAAQEAVFNAIVRDQRAALARAGLPETYGNLYLMHFAGSGAGSKILRAAADEPIERLMSAKAIEANPFLKGKTAGEVVAWAHGKMGERPHAGPVLSREGFADDAAGDAEWRAAQAEVDASDLELARVAAEEAGAGTSIADDDIPFDIDDRRARQFDGETRDPFADMPNDLAQAVPARIDGEEDLGPLRAMTVEAEPVRATVPADATDELFVMSSGVKLKGEPGFHVEDPHADGSFVYGVYRDADGSIKGLVQHPLSREDKYDQVISYVDPSVRRQGIATRLYDTLRDAGYPVDEVSGTHDLTPAGAAFVNARRSGMAARRAELFGDTDPAPAPLADAVAGGASSPIEGFGAPDDLAAMRQLDSLEHDLRMFLLEDDAKGMTVRLNDEGDVISAADAIAALDEDEAEIASARACMVPPAGETT